MYKFIFGGVASLACVEKAAGVVMLPRATNDMWALSLQSHKWSKILPSVSTNVPTARAFSQIATPGQQGGAKQLAVLIGGASFLCFDLATPCKVPQPLNDIWTADVAPKETSATDKMAEFDGKNDIIAINLPDWCADVESLSVFWMDAWLYPLNRGYSKAILFDAYQVNAGVRSSTLRWYMEGRSDGNVYVSLILNPGNAQVLVKEWGPLQHNFLGFWHHVTVTIRFARIFTTTSSSPAVTIPQAFLFVDGVSVMSSNEGKDFLNIDLAGSLVLKSGLSSIVVGGADPDIPAIGYEHFQGGMDDIRVWWPSCPQSDDPSKCNPYAPETRLRGARTGGWDPGHRSHDESGVQAREGCDVPAHAHRPAVERSACLL